MQLKEHLNPQQLKAAEHIEGPMLVIAGAGSGKTRIVTYRIAHLISLGVPASEIVAVTFTNKAADEMKQRIHKLSGAAILACTFHSLGARILRESITALGYKSHFAIFDEEDSDKVLKECLEEKQLKDEKGLQKSFRIGISHAKNNMQEPEDPLLNDIYNLYQQKLKTYNALDFDDLLFLTVKLFQQEPEILLRYQKQWNFILVDEYQDTNQAQYNLLKLLSARHQNVFAVGDPDQSIYSWRGANINNILNFERDYPGAQIVNLEQNYRSTNHILKAANSLIENNESRYEKNLWSDRGTGEKIGFCLCESDRDEVNFVLERIYSHHFKENIPLSSCVIFYRTHFQSRVFEDALLKEKLPYIIVGGISFYMRREIKDLLALLRVAYEGNDFLSFSRTINIPKRGIGPAALAKIRLHSNGDLIQACKSDLKMSVRQAEGLKSYVAMIEAIRHLIHTGAPIHEMIELAIERMHYYDYLQEDPETADERQENVEELISKAIEWEEENPEAGLAAFLEELFLKSNPDQTHQADPLRLMTIHNGKGLEFDVTFLVGLEEEIFPHVNALGNIEALEEERRLCYVGMTRAKNHLYLTAAKSRFLWGSLRSMQPSRFLSEIPQEHLKKYHTESFSTYELDEAPTTHQIGDLVFHKDFGKGIIQRVYNTSLGLTYDVLFTENEETRSLVAKYAKLAKF
ncbi:MAG: UvrD-helicase domain-containing protein [Verrucomicrobia bacterium]|nr:UvrD-helicase domain-containing protein [Verrucomicrobiota bacterium]